MRHSSTKKDKRVRRHARVRAKVSGSAERPRLAVFKSNTNLYAQLINDDTGTTIAMASSQVPGKSKTRMKKQDQAAFVGKLIAERAQQKKVSRVVFDRGGFIYQGKIKLFAEAARAAGLVF